MSDQLSAAVIGFRGWHMAGDALLPIRKSAQRAWPVGDFRAVCEGEITDQRLMHRAPAAGCACGIYAKHSDDYLARASPTVITGSVLAWGELEVHASGFRAEWARPIGLAIRPDRPAGWLAQAQAIAKRYRVPLVTFGELPVLAAEYGSPVPRTSLPVEPLEEFLRRGPWWTAWRAAVKRQLADMEQNAEVSKRLLLDAELEQVTAEARAHHRAYGAFLPLLRQGMAALLAASEAREVGGGAQFSRQGRVWIRAAIHRGLDGGALIPPVPSIGHVIGYVSAAARTGIGASRRCCRDESEGADSSYHAHQEQDLLSACEVEVIRQELMSIEGWPAKRAYKVAEAWRSDARLRRSTR